MRHLIILLVIVFAAAFVSGCGGNSDSPANPAQAAATPASTSPTLQEAAPTSSPATIQPEPLSTPTPLALTVNAGIESCSKHGNVASCYSGPLFDSHLHFNSASLAQDTPTLASLLDRDGVGMALVFVGSSGASIQGSTRIAGTAPGRVVPLIQPTLHNLERYLDDYSAPNGFAELFLAFLQPEGTFAGVGEIAMYFPSMMTFTLQNQQLQEIFSAINEVGGIAMIHPRARQSATTQEEVRQVVEAFPNVTFVFHGGEGEGIFDLVSPLMDSYANVYFTFDFAGWAGSCPRCANLFWGGSLEQDSSSSGFHTSLEWAGGPVAAAEKGAPFALEKLTKYPDRVMWGTDRFHAWHFEASVSQAVIEINRLMIGRLPQELQQAFAFGNAERVFGKYLTTEATSPPVVVSSREPLRPVNGDGLNIPSVGISGPLALLRHRARNRHASPRRRPPVFQSNFRCGEEVMAGLGARLAALEKAAGVSDHVTPGTLEVFVLIGVVLVAAGLVLDVILLFVEPGKLNIGIAAVAQTLIVVGANTGLVGALTSLLDDRRR